MFTKIITFLLFTTTLCCSTRMYQKGNEENEGKNVFFLKRPRPLPINLIPDSMIMRRTWDPFHFSSEHSLKRKIKLSVDDNGLITAFNFDGKKPQVSGGVLTVPCEFEKLYFHWDNNKSREHGSYHTVNGEYFVMDLQAYYRAVALASHFSGRLWLLQNQIQSAVIVSQFFKLGSKTNMAIEKVLNGSRRVSLDELIPSLQEYVAYKGSFVVSPFTEGVQWIISLSPQRITKTQINRFRRFTNSPITDARMIQPLYGRKVFYIHPCKN